MWESLTAELSIATYFFVTHEYFVCLIKHNNSMRRVLLSGYYAPGLSSNNSLTITTGSQTRCYCYSSLTNEKTKAQKDEIKPEVPAG